VCDLGEHDPLRGTEVVPYHLGCLAREVERAAKLPSSVSAFASAISVVVFPVCRGACTTK
jgi:hypothetical protein